jgi:type IV secretion system protein VirB9
MRWLVFVAFGLVSLSAYAAEVPRPGALDPRIQTIQYDPDQVVLLHGTLGYQFMLEFATGEHIDTVSIGDSLAWQVTPNRKADVLFLKPLSHSATNLTVLTDERRYSFELRVAPDHSPQPILYIARLLYPPPAVAMPINTAPQPEPPPIVANSSYDIKGSTLNRPVKVFDDGQMTYFEWSNDGSLPAIFAIGGDGGEALVNYVVRGPYVVVDQLAQRFILREGKEMITVTNNGFRAQHPAQEARR